MSQHRLSFCDRRRAHLARKFRVDQMEPRSLITDPISLAGLSMGLPLVWGILGLTRTNGLGGDSTAAGLLAAQGGSQTPGQGSAMAVSQPQARSLAGDQTQLPLRIVPPAGDLGFSGSAAMPATGNPPAAANSSDDWLTLTPWGDDSAPASAGFGANWKPAQRAEGQLVLPGGGSGSGDLPVTSARVQGHTAALQTVPPPPSTPAILTVPPAAQF